MNLSWSAATDNVGVTGYRVERCTGAGCTNFSQVGSPTGTTFNDIDRAASTTYRYRVRAADAAGNLGGYSSVAEAATTAAPATPPGLVGAWGFSEGNGTTTADGSGNANTATLLNGPSWVTGKYGTGLSLDGANDNLSIPNSTSLNISGTSLTLSMWINPATITGDSVVLGKFWNAGMTSPYYQYGLELSGGRPHLYIGTATGLVGAFMDSALAVNQWSHLAVVFNGSQAHFYVNGNLTGTKPLTATMTARGQLLRVGADASPWQFYRGALDNLRIYNRTLTTPELQSDMNTGL